LKYLYTTKQTAFYSEGKSSTNYNAVINYNLEAFLESDRFVLEVAQYVDLS